MLAEQKAEQKASGYHLLEVAAEISIATDIIDCLYMAGCSLNDKTQCDAMTRVASIATDHLAKATQMIEALLRDGDER